MAKYGKKAQSMVRSAMRRRKQKNIRLFSYEENLLK
jgi:hypothetical protein